LKFFYVTRDAFPSFRVDITELFSKGIAQNKHHYIDWHSQALEKSASKLKNINSFENVYLGRCLGKGGILTRFLNKLFLIKHAFKIFRIVKSNNYDFVQVRDTVFSALIALIAAKRNRIPFYYWLSFPHAEADIIRAGDSLMLISNTTRLFYFLRGKISFFLLYKVIFPRADFIFVQSDRMLEDIEKYGINRSKMMPVPMGINLDNVLNSNELPMVDARLEGKKVLMYLGTMVRDRRIEFLVEMMPSIIERFPNCVLLLVGDAPSKDVAVIKDKIRVLGLGKYVILTGFVPMSEGWGYIKRSDVCLSPFRPSPILDSTSPTKLIEYMAWGTPVVANKHPEQSKILDESQAGFAVEYDIDAFSEACIKLLSDAEDAKRRGRLGFEYVSKYRAYTILVDKLEKKYKSLLLSYTKN